MQAARIPPAHARDQTQARAATPPPEPPRAQRRTTATRIYYLDSLQGPAILFGRALASGFDMDYLENWTDRIGKLTVADVNKAASAVFSTDNVPVTGVLWLLLCLQRGLLQSARAYREVAIAAGIEPFDRSA